jgi:hypothetical protein
MSGGERARYEEAVEVNMVKRKEARATGNGV